MVEWVFLKPILCLIFSEKRKYKTLPHSIEGIKNREKCLKALINKEKFKKIWFSKIKKK